MSPFALVIGLLLAAPRPPERLADTGLFVPGTTRVAPVNLLFSPQYPLWTDGADKARWLFLPPGRAIDARRPDAWIFPVGTRLWKELAFGGRRVETRMIWRASRDTWVYAAYAWNAAGDEATLVPPEGKARAFPLGERAHAIPGRQDCLACHDAGLGPVLGVNALQLSDDRDPLAPHADLDQAGLTLSALVARRLITPALGELVTHPPRIPARTPRERAALGYLAGNCGACHNARGPLAPLGLVLAHDLTPDASERALASLIDVPGRFWVPGVTDSRRIRPGAPEQSALYHRMRSRWPSSQMPPLGSVLPDADALSLIEAWIREDLAGQP